LTFGFRYCRAGNTVTVIRNDASFFRLNGEIIGRNIQENEVVVIEGGKYTNGIQLSPKFVHIFTGAPSIGKIVMTAAAKNT
jgi:hypothetical protein